MSIIQLLPRDAMRKRGIQLYDRYPFPFTRVYYIQTAKHISKLFFSAR